MTAHDVYLAQLLREFIRLREMPAASAAAWTDLIYDADRYLRKLPPPESPTGAPRFPTMLRKMWSGTEVQEWLDARWLHYLTQFATQSRERGLMDDHEQRALLGDPTALLLLADHHDVMQDQAESCGAGTSGDGMRSVELREMARKIVAEDYEIWPDEVLRRLDFPVTPRSAWRNIAAAPRDGTPVLLKVKSMEELLIQHNSIEFAGLMFVGSNNGSLMQWGFAAPVGMGGFPDDWLAGWQPLPIDAP